MFLITNKYFYDNQQYRAFELLFKNNWFKADDGNNCTLEYVFVIPF